MQKKFLTIFFFKNEHFFLSDSPELALLCNMIFPLRNRIVVGISKKRIKWEVHEQFAPKILPTIFKTQLLLENPTVS